MTFYHKNGKFENDIQNTRIISSGHTSDKTTKSDQFGRKYIVKTMDQNSTRTLPIFSYFLSHEFTSNIVPIAYSTTRQRNHLE